MNDLKGLREKAYLSQQELSGKTGIAVSTICRLEQNKQKPRFGTIRKLAKALGIKPGEIDFSI